MFLEIKSIYPCVASLRPSYPGSLVTDWSRRHEGISHFQTLYFPSFHVLPGRGSGFEHLSPPLQVCSLHLMVPLVVFDLLPFSLEGEAGCSLLSRTHAPPRSLSAAPSLVSLRVIISFLWCRGKRLAAPGQTFSGGPKSQTQPQG